ncbi:MAG: hypothetical protein Q7U10_09040 [Thermodesulfovibrionia bacterium]|nr:hypothetical protein [Thermodesulfovibrionia bacterium]
MHKLVSIILIVFILVAGVITYSVSETARSSVMLEQNIKDNMDAHIEKVKRKNPARYQAMMERANDTVTECLSCHIELVESKENKTRKFPVK